MGRVRTVARYELWTTVRRPSFLVTTALFPALAVAALVGVVVFQVVRGERQPTATTVGYVDATGLFTGHQEQGLVTYRPYPDQDAGVRALREGEVDALVLIPPDYLTSGLVVQVRERRPGIPLGEARTPELRRFLLDNLLAGRLPPEHLARVHEPVRLTTLEVDPQGQPVVEPFDGGRFAFFLGFGFLVVLAVLMSSGFMQQGLSEEKESRIMEVLLSSVSPDQLMLGKLLGLGMAGLVQLGIWALLAAGILLAALASPLRLPPIALPHPGLALLGLLYFLLGYTLVAALMAALGAVTTSYREAQQVTFLVVLPHVAPFWFMAPLLAEPAGTLARVLSVIPFTAPVTVMVRLGLDALGPLDALLSLGSLALAAALAVGLTLRLFRTYLLMYGRRPRVGELARTLLRG